MADTDLIINSKKTRVSKLFDEIKNQFEKEYKKKFKEQQQELIKNIGEHYTHQYGKIDDDNIKSDNENIKLIIDHNHNKNTWIISYFYYYGITNNSTDDRDINFLIIDNYGRMIHRTVSDKYYCGNIILILNKPKNNLYPLPNILIDNIKEYSNCFKNMSEVNNDLNLKMYKYFKNIQNLAKEYYNRFLYRSCLIKKN